MQPQENEILQRSYQSGWHDLIQFLFNQVISDSQDSEAHEKLRQIGAAIAARHPLPPCDSIAALEACLNDLLGHFDWGFVRIAPARHELILVHCAWPHTPTQGENAQWRLASACMLAGAYGEWISAQGGRNEVTTNWHAKDTDDVLIFRYALHA
ncbi:cellulose biosynthesis protein BcsD [Martelella alba]|nr:cellulose biosynthesis protein BcsD [Martelella alba]